MAKFGPKNKSCESLEEAIQKVQDLTKEIASDGVITDQELEELIAWLNSNSNFKTDWPFNLLYKFLFNALEDGVFSEEEKKQLIRLIYEIQAAPVQSALCENEHEGLNEVKSHSNNGTIFGKIITFFFPGPGEIIEVKSHSNPNISYQVEIDRRTCNCPDFVTNRRKFSENDYRRLCKHLIEAMVCSKKTESFPPAIHEFFMTKYLEKKGVFWIEEFHELKILGEVILISKAESSPWVNVFSKAKSRKSENISYKRFGFHLLEKRWSYGTSPGNNEEIEKSIYKIW